MSAPPASGFRLTRLLARRGTPSFFFAPQSTPAHPLRHRHVLPPASCWKHPEHEAPEPDCACGYHWFTALPSAVEYLDLFAAAPHRRRPPASRFLVGFVPVGSNLPLPPVSVYRAAAGSYVSLYLPRTCWCLDPASGLARFRPQHHTQDDLDHSMGFDPVSPACARHQDRILTESFKEVLPILPLPRV